VTGVGHEAGVGGELETASTGEAAQRSRRRDVEERFGGDPAGCGERGAGAEQRLPRPRVGEDHGPAGEHDAEGEDDGIRPGAHGEEHAVAALHPVPAQTFGGRPDRRPKFGVGEGFETRRPLAGAPQPASECRSRAVDIAGGEDRIKEVAHARCSSSEAYEGMRTPREGRREAMRRVGVSSRASRVSRICAIASGAPRQ
jgi:hypothetical protein